MHGVYKLMLKLMYGCGLRIKDIDFSYDKVYIWDSKSQKDRTIPLPTMIKDELKIEIKKFLPIHFAIHMLHICFKMAQIFAQFKNF